MVRTKKIFKHAACCLIAHSLICSSSEAASHAVGKITQSKGEISYLEFLSPKNLVQVNKNSDLLTDGSYLTHESAFFTAQLFEGAWLRVSPHTKIALEFDPEEKIITIHLFTGSIKVLFSSAALKDKVQKCIVKSAGAQFETVEAKFVVSRNLVRDESSVYVEKGSVMAVQTQLNEKKDMEIVHTHETTSIIDRENDVQSPRKMTPRELKFLHSSSYLK